MLIMMAGTHTRGGRESPSLARISHSSCCIRLASLFRSGCGCGHAGVGCRRNLGAGAGCCCSRGAEGYHCSYGAGGCCRRHGVEGCCHRHGAGGCRCSHGAEGCVLGLGVGGGTKASGFDTNDGRRVHEGAEDSAKIHTLYVPLTKCGHGHPLPPSYT